MGALRASHHNFQRLCRELCLGCAGPWTARVTSGYATSEVLAMSSRGHRDEAPISGVVCHCGDDIRAQLRLSSGSAHAQLRSGIQLERNVRAPCKPLTGSGRATSQERRRQDDAARQICRHIFASLTSLLEVKHESTRVLLEHQSSVFYDIV